MFQQIFRTQSEQLLFLPLVALVLFITVFVVRVAHAFLQNDQLTEAQSRLPLNDGERHE